MFGWFKNTTNQTVSSSSSEGKGSSWYDRLKHGLSKTKGALLDPLLRYWSLKENLSSEEILALKKTLIAADIGPKLTKELIEIVVKKTSSQNIIPELKAYLLSLCLHAPEKGLNDVKAFMMVGVNGAGKTTSTAKLGVFYKKNNPLFIAADTYRAAAIEQLQHWAHKYQLGFFTSTTLDPAAVAFQGLSYAEEHGHQLSFIDTSGRLHTNKNLMQELCKIKRVILKKIPEHSLKTLLILDGSQGQNMLEQTKIFKQDLGIDGIVLTKIDGSSKAGAIFEVMRSYQCPIYFIGFGESVEDIEPFDPNQFINAIFGED
jgi:fused signal recognition particle receptor